MMLLLIVRALHMVCHVWSVQLLVGKLFVAMPMPPMVCLVLGFLCCSFFFWRVLLTLLCMMVRSVPLFVAKLFVCMPVMLVAHLNLLMLILILMPLIILRDL